jgi:mevalonate kinase
MAAPRGGPGAIRLQAPDIGLDANYGDLSPDDPLAFAIYLVLEIIGLETAPACVIRVTSTIPLASGMGSGAAVTVALLRALSAFLGHPLPDAHVNQLAFEVEVLYHGTPSGIDNTVVTYAKPVFFTRGEDTQMLNVPQPFTIVIGDTGVPSPTAITVGDVREAWREQPDVYESVFDEIGEIGHRARRAIESGDVGELGPLMGSNQRLLQQLNVSSDELEGLIEAAMEAGALGAKISGGGRGGNMIALVDPEEADNVTGALQARGAVRTITTVVGAES